jgi:limonene 1,2-monooxygenase
MSERLRFGIFLAPFHKPGINPTLALQSDLELIQWLDRCGYDEAWLGNTTPPAPSFPPRRKS